MSTLNLDDYVKPRGLRRTDLFELDRKTAYSNVLRANLFRFTEMQCIIAFTSIGGKKLVLLVK